jgi:hypothetical protein
MLRLVDDGKVVETSLGARFPIEDARKGWLFVKALKAAGKTFTSNGERFPLGDFQLDRVEEDGTVIAGCHTVLFDEIQQFAEKYLEVSDAIQ